MRGCCIVSVLMLCTCSMSQDRVPPFAPTQLVIAKHTFIDVGSPNDFYELTFVHQATNGSAIEKVTLTPPTDQCYAPTKIEVAEATLQESVADLLGKTNPCAIPERELHRELKRCKKCLVFSGANVSMQVRCGSRTRIIRSDILDRDMFDPDPKTPEHTSWTMHLLSRIDQATGPGVLEHPLFTLDPQTKNTPVTHSGNLEEIASGKYDELFRNTPDKPSDLYRAAQITPILPSVRLLSSIPIQPETFGLPGYPPIAKLAKIEGTVSFTVGINEDGSTKDFSVENGHPMLRPAVQDAVGHWKFSTAAAGHTIHAVVQFATNCPANKASGKNP
jgi:TonB family protein